MNAWQINTIKLKKFSILVSDRNNVSRLFDQKQLLWVFLHVIVFVCQVCINRFSKRQFVQLFIVLGDGSWEITNASLIASLFTYCICCKIILFQWNEIKFVKTNLMLNKFFYSYLNVSFLALYFWLRNKIVILLSYVYMTPINWYLINISLNIF